jgi:beta-lactamase class A
LMLHFQRRDILLGGSTLLLTGCAASSSVRAPDISEEPLSALEANSGGRLGVYILDTASGKSTGHRVDDRFAHCSSFKLSLAAAVLHMAERGTVKLDTFLPYSKVDLLGVSPVTTENLAKGGMTVEALAKATQITSDNAAANLLLKHIGGPSAMTAFWRSLGDTVSRVDNYEPELNRVGPGEIHDTTSPKAMAHSLSKILTGNVLSPASRDTLIGWMIDTETGLKRIRAGLPASWRAGDKTGTGMHKDYNNYYIDLVIFWPPSRPPVIVTAYYQADGYYDDMRDTDLAILAQVGRIAAAQAVEWHGGLD